VPHSHSENDPGFGRGIKTSLAIAGLHGTAIVKLEGVGKLELKDLLSHHTLVLPWVPERDAAAGATPTVPSRLHS